MAVGHHYISCLRRRHLSARVIRQGFLPARSAAAACRMGHGPAAGSAARAGGGGSDRPYLSFSCIRRTRTARGLAPALESIYFERSSVSGESAIRTILSVELDVSAIADTVGMDNG